MNNMQHLHRIFAGKLAQAVQEYLHGDWSRVPELEKIAPTVFDAWADGTELPFESVSKVKGQQDGIYVLFDQEGWLVFEQKSRVQLPGARVYSTYKLAKRAALKIAFLNQLRSKS